LPRRFESVAATLNVVSKKVRKIEAWGGDQIGELYDEIGLQMKRIENALGNILSIIPNDKEQKTGV
jgi:hypothetical protein